MSAFMQVKFVTVILLDRSNGKLMARTIEYGKSCTNKCVFRFLFKQKFGYIVRIFEYLIGMLILTKQTVSK